MTQIAFVDTAQPDPTKQFADNAWRANPRISPSSWRLAQGLTLSKIMMDGRLDLQGWPAAVAAGCNGLLVSAATAPQLDHKPEGTVVVLETANIDEIPAGVDVVLVPPAFADWAKLEQAVKDETLLGYGLTSTGWDDLGPSLMAADEAASRVWGRRKRSGLMALMVPFNLAEQQAAREPVCQVGTEVLSPLELAARRGWLVLADRPALWHGPWGLCDITAPDHPVALKAQALMQQRLPEPWRNLPAAIQAWGIATSMAGVTTAVAQMTAQSSSTFIEQAMQQPDLVDIAGILEGA